MAYVKPKRINGGVYYYLVEAYRADGKVKSRTLAYLGKVPEVPNHLIHLMARSRRQRALAWEPGALGAAIVRAVERGPIASATARRV